MILSERPQARPPTPSVLGPLLATCMLAGACASTIEGPVDDSPATIVSWSDHALAVGATEQAVDELAELRRRKGLTPEELNRAEAALVAAVEAHISASRAGDDAIDDLQDLFDVELPRHLEAQAGVAAAQAELESGDRRDAFQTIRRLDQRQPGHVEHVAAADIVAEAGFSLAQDPGSYFLGLASYRGYSPRVLEYLVLNYPTHPDCAAAYATLAEIYEDDGEWNLAIERHEELVLYHTESPPSIASQLRIPELRMRRLMRVDYDRGGLVKARTELRNWLARHAGHELEPRAQELWTVCLRRLALNDMSVARFYEDVDRAYGSWQHAERALAEAQEGGDEALAAEIELFLASLPPLDELLEDVSGSAAPVSDSGSPTGDRAP